jgi:hypothetical protein
VILKTWSYKFQNPVVTFAIPQNKAFHEIQSVLKSSACFYLYFQDPKASTEWQNEQNTKIIVAICGVLFGLALVVLFFIYKYCFTKGKL